MMMRTLRRNAYKDHTLQRGASRVRRAPPASGPRRVEAPDHDGVLRVHAVLGLAEDVRLRRFHHAVGHLLVALRGQAVQEDRLLLAGRGQQRLVDLERLEDLRAGRRLVLLAHARPHVRVDDVCARDRLQRIVAHAGAAGALLDRGEQPRVWLVPLRARAHEVEGQHARELEPRVDDVVAVAHVDDALALDGAQQLSTVSASAMIWQGWLKSVSPLMTGTDEYSARSMMSWCAKSRDITTSFMLASTRDTSLAASRLPI